MSPFWKGQSLELLAILATSFQGSELAWPPLESDHSFGSVRVNIDLSLDRSADTVAAFRVLYRQIRRFAGQNLRNFWMSHCNLRSDVRAGRAVHGNSCSPSWRLHGSDSHGPQVGHYGGDLVLILSLMLSMAEPGVATETALYEWIFVFVFCSCSALENRS